MGGGMEWITSVLSTLNTTTEVLLSKAPNPKLLPGRHSACPLLRVCVHYCVCAHLDGSNRAQIPNMGHHTWPHVTSKEKDSFQTIFSSISPKTTQYFSTPLKCFTFTYINLIRLSNFMTGALCPYKSMNGTFDPSCFQPKQAPPSKNRTF